MRACHPRDLVEQVVDICRYQNKTPVITRELLDMACSSYFLEEAGIAGSGSMKATSVEMGLAGAPAAAETLDYPAVLRFAADLAARATIVVLFSIMAVRFGSDFINTGRLTGLFLLASEALVVVLTVFRRSAVAVDRSFKARVLTIVSILGPPLLAPAAVAPLAAEGITVALSCAGLAVVIAGKITLGRSFALLPGEPRRGLDRSLQDRPAPDLHGLPGHPRRVPRRQPVALEHRRARCC